MMRRIKAVTANALAGQLFRVLSHPEVEKRFAEMLRRGLVRGLGEQEVKNCLWEADRYRPGGAEFHWASKPNSIEEERYRLATLETAQFVTAQMSDAPNFANPLHLLNYCMERLIIEGDVLEFGVYTGTTINHIARSTDNTVHGFDSFRGLPEDWNNAPAGTFDAKGEPPPVEQNVELHVGLFAETLPGFVNQNPGPIAFLHIDCDLYSSTQTVLSGLESKIVPGTTIVFDEYFNYPNWREHEFKAFAEFTERTGKRFEYIGYTDRGFSAAVKML